MRGLDFSGRPRERRRLILDILYEEDAARLENVWVLADEVRRKYVGDRVHLRGLIEFSNRCVRGCTYCGLRSGNRLLTRYRMSREEILECADLAFSFGYGTVVLQSGEDDELDPRWLGEIIDAIKQKHSLAVTLSVGEKPVEHLRLWREKGADRYLLKFETSDPELFKRIHPRRRPEDPGRLELLAALKDLGYEIGGGVMVGIPGQIYMSLYHDLELFDDLDLDMIGIGPFIPNIRTPLGREYYESKTRPPDQAPNTDLVTHKMIALARIYRPDANIPATTALASVDPCGFEGGLKAGANVIMPNITPLAYRSLYQIYPHGFFQSREETHNRIMHAIAAAGRKPAVGRGDRRRGGVSGNAPVSQPGPGNADCSHFRG